MAVIRSWVRVVILGALLLFGLLIVLPTTARGPWGD